MNNKPNPKPGQPSDAKTAESVSQSHTPGPWHWVPFIVGTGVTIKDTTGTGIATTVTFRPYENSLANARLIAAAPDLRAACRALLDYEKRMDGADGYGENEDKYWEAVRLARAAITKAEAQEPTP